MTHGLFPHLLLLSAFCGASLSCSSPSRDITIRSIPSGASLRVNGDYAGQAPVTLSLNRHKPVHVAADKPGFLSTEKTFYPEMTTQGAILWGRNNEKSKDFKTDILTIRLKKGALMLRNNPELNITEISDKIGFSSSRYFSKCFKDVYHVSPLAYRKGEDADKEEKNEEDEEG